MDPNKPEPAPEPNATTPIWERVIEDMRRRDEDGRTKYGVPLQSFNKRRALVDLYQELLDGVVYCRQAIEELEGVQCVPDEILVELSGRAQPNIDGGLPAEPIAVQSKTLHDLIREVTYYRNYLRHG